MKEIYEVCLELRAGNQFKNPEIVSPGMLERVGIHVSVTSNECFSISGDFQSRQVSLRGVYEGEVIETSHITNVCGNVVTTFTGSLYEIKSFSSDYVELANFEKNGGKVLFDWCLGYDGINHQILMAAQCFSKKGFSYVEDEFKSFGEKDFGLDKNLVIINDECYFLIWSNVNSYQAYRLRGVNFNFKLSFFAEIVPFPDGIIFVASQTCAYRNSIFTNPRHKEALINDVIK